MNALTLYPPSLQTSPGKHLNSGVNRACVAHNASNAGSSRLLQQHAKETAAAFPPELTSSRAISLRISSTLRQGCIEARRFVRPRTSNTRLKYNSHSMPMLLRVFIISRCCGHEPRSLRNAWGASGNMRRPSIERLSTKEKLHAYKRRH